MTFDNLTGQLFWPTPLKDWRIEEHGFQPEAVIKNGNKFLTANGYMGYRGTLEENGAAELAAVNLSGVYDQRGTAWREPVNAPNPFHVVTRVAGQVLDPLQHPISDHEQVLDMAAAVHHRRTTFSTGNTLVTITANRFLDMAQPQFMFLEYIVQVKQATVISVTAGIDKQIWDINGPHLVDCQSWREDSVFGYGGQTGESQLAVTTLSRILVNQGECNDIDRPDQVGQTIAVTVTPERPLCLLIAAAVTTGRETDAPIAALADTLASYTPETIGQEYTRHCQKLAALWHTSDIQIEGPQQDQVALRYNILALMMIAPLAGSQLSIPARGLSGQTYKGAVFWDTELFMTPFFLATQPTVVHDLVAYRLKGLIGAKKKAVEYGYTGAFYAWESQEDGYDATSDYNVTDVFTNRPMRTYFKDKQIHISGDVALAIWHAFQWLQDPAILTQGGAEVIVECARFYVSYATARLDRPEVAFADVIGPDEYHERVNNNAFTNRVALATIEAALAAVAYLQENNAEYSAKIAQQWQLTDLLPLFTETAARIRLQTPNAAGVISQFDGYLALADDSIDTVRSRLLKPKEYWGGAYGVASQTQVIKQADVVMMLAAFPNDFSSDIVRANWQYYEPRTEHGSSLSYSMYGLIAAQLGMTAPAYDFFQKTAEIDLTGESKQWAGTIYIGGTHPAASGGTWRLAVEGFAGLHVENDQLVATPHLPSQWQKMAFRTYYQGHWYRVNVTAAGAVVSIADDEKIGVDD